MLFFTFSYSSMLLLNWLYSRLDRKWMSFSPNSSFSLLMPLSQFLRQGFSRCLTPSWICKEFLVEIFINFDNNFQFSSSMALLFFSISFLSFYFTQGRISTELLVRELGDFGDLLFIYLSFCLCFTQSMLRSSLQRGFVEAHFASMSIKIIAKVGELIIIIICHCRMDPEQNGDQERESQLRNLLQFAYAQRKYQKVLELADSYHAQFSESKEVYLFKAKAHSELAKPEQSLKALQSAIKLGAITSEVFRLKIRCLIESRDVKEAEREMRKLVQRDQELKNIFELWQAINLMKDDFGIHRLTQKQETILDSMNKWLYKAGAHYDKLKVVNLSAGYRGVVATKHIKKKEPLVFIPKSELITLEMAKANKYNQQLIERKIKLQSPKHTYVSILLLQLKADPNSKFKPYIDLLPQDHSCFPINYSKGELEMLEGSPFLNMIYEKVIDLKRDYEAVLKCDPSIQKYSFKEFCWARMMIGSRIFGLQISGVKTEVLVPFADMLNHRHPKETVWNYEEHMNGFVIESLEDIEVGQEVFDSYGRKCNSRFLLHYGFIIPDNPDNEIAIKITIGLEDPFHKQKKQMLRENVNQVYAEVKKISLNLNNNKFYELMGCLRFICIDDNETLNMLKRISGIQVKKETYVMVKTPPISVKNEIMVWKKFSQLCEALKASYHTTIEEDEERLKDPKRTQNEKNIISLLIGEKRIITNFIKICQEVNQILNSQNIIQGLESKIAGLYARYLYKILSLTPGINKKGLEKKLGHNFITQTEQKEQQMQEIPQN